MRAYLRMFELGLVPGDHVRDQPSPSVCFLTGYNHGFLNRWMLKQSGLNLCEFDPISSNLDLMVQSTDILYVSINASPYQVPGPVQANARLLCVRIRQIPFGGHLVPLPISSADGNPSNVQLTHHS